MALLFDILQAERLSQGNSLALIAILEYQYTGKPTISYKKVGGITIPPIKLRGSSFILNPAPLFKSTADPEFIAQYIRLAGRRDYAMYKIRGVITLDLSYFPDIDISNITSNPLLTIDNNLIKFIYEENYGTKVR